MSYRRTTSVIALVIFFMTSSAIAGSFWVKSRYARLRAGTSSRDKVVSRLKHGQELTVVEKKGGFIRARLADGKVGWVSMTWLTNKKPKTGNQRLEALGAAARSDGSKLSYTAGARGLSAQAKAYAKSRVDAKTAMEAIERLEKIKISDDALEAFLRAGKLGDYREVK